MVCPPNGCGAGRDHVRVIRWQHRAQHGQLNDARPRPDEASHALLADEREAILRIAEACADVDRSHRKRAHRGSRLEGMKLVWNPEGASVRQHTEPAGNQHVWPYHLHVFPRYRDDMLYRQVRHRLDTAVRAEKAEQLRPALQQGLGHCGSSPDTPARNHRAVGTNKARAG